MAKDNLQSIRGVFKVHERQKDKRVMVIIYDRRFWDGIHGWGVFKSVKKCETLENIAE
jgi:hypothetical protein